VRGRGRGGQAVHDGDLPQQFRGDLVPHNG